MIYLWIEVLHTDISNVLMISCQDKSVEWNLS
jgi:hypothetical protein